MTQPAFIVIDIQNDYFPEGAMPLEEVGGAAKKGQTALEYARQKELAVIVVQHISLSPNATFFRPNTAGAEIYPGFHPRQSELHLVKHYPNAFRETNLHERLQSLGIKALVVCGMMTHMCIDSTVRAAADLGFSVTLLGDATATRDLRYNDRSVPALAVQTAVLASLHGTFARVVATRDWIDGA